MTFDDFLKCCGSTTWAKSMVEKAPFLSKEKLFETATLEWFKCSEKDWLEAFSHHPKIGDKTNSKWASSEQKGVNSADENTKIELQKLNIDYENKFGFIFLICATGKSAEEMLQSLKSRLKNNRMTEIKNAANEQSKITLIRLEKWINENEK